MPTDERPVLRDRTGRIQPGSAAMNPGGRPPIDEEVKVILRAAAPGAAKKLVELAFNAQDPRVSLAAITVLLDRLYGRPAQQISADIQTTSIQEAHLAALQEITRRREERAREEREQGDGAKVINIDPRPPMRDAETFEPVVVETVAVATELPDAAEPGDEDDRFGTPV